MVVKTKETVQENETLNLLLQQIIASAKQYLQNKEVAYDYRKNGQQTANQKTDC